MTPRVRFAPSPTGYLHVGGARTALFNYLYARKTGGMFILRIEDTDRERSTPEAIEAILEGMRWLGLHWDEGPFFQTQRFDLYQQKIDELLAAGKAYPCFCTVETLEANRAEDMAAKRKPRYRGTCRQLSADDIAAKKAQGVPYSIRFRSPDEGDTIVLDGLRGEIRFANIELDDLIIRRASDGYPTYNFTVVIDDATMAMTHVIRGDDHLNNTPRQAQLYEALGYPVPMFYHVPMILGVDKKRLSKRHGATSVLAYRDMGYLPEALLNYLVKLGWSCGDQEVFTQAEMIEKFNLEGLSKSAGVFNPEKLLWLNGVYIRNASAADLAERTLPFLAEHGIASPDRRLLEGAIEISKEKVKTLVELADMIAFFFVPPTTDSSSALADLISDERALSHLRELKKHLEATTPWTPETIKASINTTCETLGIKLKELAHAVRLCVTGAAISPSIFDIFAVLGKEASLKRLR